MKILVTGGGGQVGREFQRLCWPARAEIIICDRAQLDITNRDEIARTIVPPLDVVINLAAYTAVDRAEEERDAAIAANVDGPARLADRCAALHIPMIHLSTDYVFSGTSNSPYLEDDAAHPCNHYGLTKWQGEEAVRACLDQHIILRTASVFSQFGSNFVKSMLRLGRERTELGVVGDQSSCPTPARAIALALARLGTQLANRPERQIWGTYHFCGQPPVTWYNFAQKIFEIAIARGARAPRLYPIRADEYPGAAARPANSAMDCGKIRMLGIEAPAWTEHLPRIVSDILAGGAPA